MDAASTGQMAIAWVECNYHAYYRPGKIYCRTSPDSGITWNPIVELTIDTTIVHRDPRVAVSGDTVIVVFHTRNAALLRRSFDLGFTWTPPETVAYGHNMVFNPDVDIDNGKIYVSYVDNVNLLLYFGRWDPETSVEHESNLPQQIALGPNYPNPFNASTVISYFLPAASPVSLDIYDLLGRKLVRLYEGNQQAGEHSLRWDASSMATGIYFYRLSTGDEVRAGKALLVR